MYHEAMFRRSLALVLLILIVSNITSVVALTNAFDSTEELVTNGGHPDSYAQYNTRFLMGDSNGIGVRNVTVAGSEDQSYSSNQVILKY